MIFDEVVFFCDTGFMEGGLDVPALPSTIGGVTYDNLTITDADCSTYGDDTVTDVTVQKATMFSEMKIPVDYIPRAMRWTYLRAKYSAVYESGGTYTDVDNVVYGWVDSVEVITSREASDSAHNDAVRVRWHLDLWRTYGASAKFGRGTLKRGKLGSVTTVAPPQNWPAVQRYMPRDVLYNDVNTGTSDADPPRAVRLATDPNDLLYAVVAFNSDENTSTSSLIRYLVIPFASDGLAIDLYFPANGPLFPALSGVGISITDIYTGRIGECYGIAPSRITGAWICSAELMSLTWNSVDHRYEGTAADRSFYGFANDPDPDSPDIHDIFLGYIYSPLDISSIVQEISITQWTYDEISTVYDRIGNVAIGTNDTAEVRVVSPEGDVVGLTPYGFGFKKAYTSIDITPTSAYYVVRLNSMTSSFIDGWSGALIGNDESNQYGFEFHIPLPAVPIAANSWSEYAFSGDRQYDIESRVAQQEIAYTKGLVNIGTSALQGGTMGLISGNPAVGIAGAIIGAVSGTVSAVGEKVTDEAWNGTLQNLEDMRASGQSESIVLPGGGMSWLFSGRLHPRLERWEVDDFSSDRIEKQKALSGWTFDKPLDDCSSCFDVASNGEYPLQIADLEVTGDIPNSARSYIRQRLAQGVRLIQKKRW